MALNYDFTACAEGNDETIAQWGFAVGVHIAMNCGIPRIERDGKIGRNQTIARVLTYQGLIGALAGERDMTVEDLNTLLDVFEGAVFSNCVWKTEAEFVRDMKKKLAEDHKGRQFWVARRQQRLAGQAAEDLKASVALATS